MQSGNVAPFFRISLVVLIVFSKKICYLFQFVLIIIIIMLFFAVQTLSTVLQKSYVVAMLFVPRQQQHGPVKTYCIAYRFILKLLMKL
jgi:hypothetical protein